MNVPKSGLRGAATAVVAAGRWCVKVVRQGSVKAKWSRELIDTQNERANERRNECEKERWICGGGARHGSQYTDGVCIPPAITIIIHSNFQPPCQPASQPSSELCVRVTEQQHTVSKGTGRVRWCCSQCWSAVVLSSGNRAGATNTVVPGPYQYLY